MGFTEEVDKKRAELTTPQFEVLRGMQNNLTITDIARLRKVSRQSTYKVIDTLIKKGFLEKIENSYSLTGLGIEGLHSFVAFRYKLRQHNFHVKFKILDTPRNWGKKRNEFIRLPYFNKRIKLKNNEQDLFNYGNLMIKTTTKSIIVKLPTVYAKDVQEATRQTFHIIEQIYPKIERLFKVKLVKNYKSSIEVICQEYANLQGIMAKMYEKKGEYLCIRNEKGEIWMITDRSFNVGEDEFVHPKSAADDQPAIETAMNVLKDNPKIMLENQKEVANLKGVFPAMSEYNKNLKLHIRVQREQLKTQKAMQKMLQRLEEKLR